MQQMGSGALHRNLTEREWEVYRLILEGKKNLEIAKELTVEVSTVKYHVSRVLTKLGVSSRSEAIAYGVQHRLTGAGRPD